MEDNARKMDRLSHPLWWTAYRSLHQSSWWCEQSNETESIHNQVRVQWFYRRVLRVHMTQFIIWLFYALRIWKNRPCTLNKTDAGDDQETWESIHSIETCLEEPRLWTVRWWRRIRTAGAETSTSSHCEIGGRSRTLLNFGISST